MLDPLVDAASVEFPGFTVPCTGNEARRRNCFLPNHDGDVIGRAAQALGDIGSADFIRRRSVEMVRYASEIRSNISNR